jgi:HlyD family secretion protein
VNGGLEPPLLLRGLVAAGEQGHALRHPDDDDEELFCPDLVIAELDRAAIGIDNCQHADDFAKDATAITLDPVIYSESSRAKLIYRVEARPPAQQAPFLNPGEPVAVRSRKIARDDRLRHRRL